MGLKFKGEKSKNVKSDYHSAVYLSLECLIDLSPVNQCWSSLDQYQILKNANQEDNAHRLNYQLLSDLI